MASVRVEPIKEEEEKAPEEECGIGDMAAATFVYKCSASRGVWLSLLLHSSKSFGVDAAEEFKEKHAKCLMLLVKDLVLSSQDDAVD
nr:hypothetical protein [Tanacetum cinerariifolium]